MSGATSHVFICFSSSDEAVARSVVQFLEAEGLKCWVSSRDVLPGHNYQESIVKALEQAKGVVFLFSTSSSASGEIKKELSVAGSLHMPVFPLRLSPITPTGALRYELATRQWIDMFPDRELALARLAETIREVLSSADPAFAESAETSAMAASPGVTLSVTHVAAQSALKQSTQPASTPIVAPGTEEFEAIRALLARHIGPIAKVMVQRAALEAPTPDDFCERLAAHVSAPSDRAAFLRAARARLAIKP